MAHRAVPPASSFSGPGPRRCLSEAENIPRGQKREQRCVLQSQHNVFVQLHLALCGKEYFVVMPACGSPESNGSVPLDILSAAASWGQEQ